MRPGMKMLMISRDRNEPDRRDMSRMPRNGADEWYIRRGDVSNRGRKRYDNGRFAPRNNYDYGTTNNYDDRSDMRYDRDMRRDYDMRDNYREGHEEMRRGVRSEYDEDEMEDGWRVPPVYERMNQIGFSANAEHESGGEMKSTHRPKMGRVPFTQEMAEEWMAGLRNEDGTTGPHWTLQQVKQVMQQKGVECDPYKLWAAMNAEYSDRCMVNKKHGVNTVDYYLDSAIAFWIKDRDAVDDKLSVYYMDVVKH